VKKGSVAAAGAALVVVAGIAGCSSPPPPPPQPPGSLPPSTAHVSVNGTDAGTTHAIHCSQDDHYMTIDTGDKTAGVTAVVQSVEGGFKLAAKSVQIRNLGGFTGSYWDGLVGNAEASVAGNTYTITGTVDGFVSDHPDKRTTGTFQIRANC
jgi:ipoprotein LpqH